jgi:hypothetical protein
MKIQFKKDFILKSTEIDQDELMGPINELINEGADEAKERTSSQNTFMNYINGFMETKKAQINQMLKEAYLSHENIHFRIRDDHDLSFTVTGMGSFQDTRKCDWQMSIKTESEIYLLHQILTEKLFVCRKLEIAQELIYVRPLEGTRIFIVD